MYGRLRPALALLGVLGLAACVDTSIVPSCKAGQVRFAGRPPARLFAYDSTCRRDCFSSPSGACDAECPEVAVRSPLGRLANDRELSLGTFWDLGDGRALVYSFAFIDEAGGRAPDGWGFLATGGSRTYLAGETRATARFVMETTVRAQDPEGRARSDFDNFTIPVGEPLLAAPGRLELSIATSSHIAGRFYLFYESLRHEPEGEVLGCFDLRVRPSADGDATLQDLAP